MRPTRARLMFSGIAIAGALVLGACSSETEGTASSTADTSDKFLVNDITLPEFDPAVAVALQDEGSVLVGWAEAPTTIDVWVDPLCPACAKFDIAYGGDIEQAVAEGKLAVRYHTLDFLAERSASRDYSTRAAAASMCVAEGSDAAQFVGFHSAVFDMQPQMGGSEDLSNDHLSAIAAAVGSSNQVLQCISTGAKEADAAAAAAASSADLAARNDDKVSTPTVFHGDQQVDITNVDWVSELTA